LTQFRKIGEHHPCIKYSQLQRSLSSFSPNPYSQAARRRLQTPYLYIGWPNDGQVIAAGEPFRVWFGLRNMGVAPKDVKFPNTGHHHLLIDTDLPPSDQVIPSDRNHLHFGAGETETMVELPPGKHTLQLLMGDDKHFPHNPPVYSKKISVIVK